MGSVSFRLPTQLTPETRECLHRAVLAAGYDQSPVPTKRSIDGSILRLSKEGSDSITLVIPWCYHSIRDICPSTTLRERDEPYDLLVELARGKICRLKQQLAEWEAIGLLLEPELREQIRQATRLFGQAVRDPQEPAAEWLAQEAMFRATDASMKLSATFADQLLQTRQVEKERLDTRVGLRLDSRPEPTLNSSLRAKFNSVKLVPIWAQIQPEENRWDWQPLDALVEWAEEQNYHITMGPLIDLTTGLLPGWLLACKDDRIVLTHAAQRFVQETVQRYKKRIRSWHLGTGFNHADFFSLDEDARLRLATVLLQTVHQLDDHASLIVGISSPWADYLEQESNTYSPLVFADTLIRAGVPLAAVELEIFLGQPPRGADFRDPILLYKLIELFGLLTIPLEVCFGESQRQPGQPPAMELVVQAALALSLPHVAGVYWDLPEATGQRRGELGSGSLLRFLQDFREHFLEPDTKRP